MGHGLGPPNAERHEPAGSPGGIWRRRGLTLVAASALVLLSAGAPAHAQPPRSEVSFSAAGLFPEYKPWIRDYVIRCRDRPVTVKAHVTGHWEAAIGKHPFQTGDYTVGVRLATGQAFTISVRESGNGVTYSYHVRCLPSDFPTYTFTRSGPVSPRFFSVNQEFVPNDTRYAIVFDAHGVPVWWYHAPARDPTVRSDGTVSWFDFRSRQFEIHRLDGTLIGTVSAVGPHGMPRRANPHDLQRLANGDYLVGADVEQMHVDTSAYGGSSDSSVLNAELQEVSPAGQLLWDWRSQDHISLAETGRFWKWVTRRPSPFGYDIVHWNSIEPDGNGVIASFRHLDAVYKIRQSTGQIAWKLGGTETPRSLTVEGDPDKPTFGAQHDARLLPDGTLTVFDNRTSLANRTPRAVRFQIDQKARTATLLDSITDPSVNASFCCGSARRLENGDWLISWGQNNGIGGYLPDGTRTFLLKLTSGEQHFSYRAEPVPPSITADDLRAGMDSMYGLP
jgi:Arylsulfotransferase (ASST)